MIMADLEQKRVKVLVADDFRTLRELMRGCLVQLGYKDITTAGDGAEAINLINNYKFDIILCDWHMPKALGIDVLRAARNSETCKDTIFILATTESEQGSVLQAVEAGVSNYIVKPFTVETLQSKIDSAIKKRVS